MDINNQLMHMATDIEQFLIELKEPGVVWWCRKKDLTSFLEDMCTICNLCTDVCNGSLSLFNWIVID